MVSIGCSNASSIVIRDALLAAISRQSLASSRPARLLLPTCRNCVRVSCSREPLKSTSASGNGAQARKTRGKGLPRAEAGNKTRAMRSGSSWNASAHAEAISASSASVGLRSRPSSRLALRVRANPPLCGRPARRHRSASPPQRCHDRCRRCRWPPRSGRTPWPPGLPSCPSGPRPSRSPATRLSRLLSWFGQARVLRRCACPSRRSRSSPCEGRPHEPENRLPCGRAADGSWRFRTAAHLTGHAARLEGG